MKNKIVLIVVAVFSSVYSCLGQGALTPPGAPAATMKSLAQIEPRTPISSVPITISVSGSYYLTANVTTTVSNAIIITASGVTLDLNGFTIASTVTNAANGGNAILLAGTAVAGLNDITIFNGHIRSGVTNNGSGVFSGRGFNEGIINSGGPSRNVLVSRLTVEGCLDNGIYLDSDSTVVEFCVTRSMGGYGISAAIIRNSTAADCNDYALDGTMISDCFATVTGTGSAINGVMVNNCYGYCTGTGTGVSADTAINCYGSSTGSGEGVSATTANNCQGYSYGNGTGISATTLNNCYGYSNGGYGIYCYVANSCYAYSSGGGYGIYANGPATGCYGYCYSGTGLYAFIANACRGGTGSGTGLSATHNVSSF